MVDPHGIVGIGPLFCIYSKLFSIRVLNVSVDSINHIDSFISPPSYECADTLFPFFKQINAIFSS